MIRFIIRQFTNTPFYPHWLEFYKRERGNQHSLRCLKGRIIEVGAGNGSMKNYLIDKHKEIKEYVSTDCSDWDNEFEKIDRKAKKFCGLLGVFLKIKQKLPVDKKCSALNLPFNDNEFDYYLSFEVLEHIDNPYKFFNEARRVLRKKGYLILSVPFLYREHHSDYFRYTYNFFNKVAQENNLNLIEVYCDTGFGTTFASLTNQWLIQRISASKTPTRIFLFLLSPFIFFLTNILGFLIDIKPDRNFATRFHVTMQRQ